jgi:hypothetical protein
MTNCVVPPTNQANTQDWLNATRNLAITSYLENTPRALIGYDITGTIEKARYTKYGGLTLPPPQSSSFDWEAGANTLLGQYDEAWRRLAGL